jgi:uncharacterized protein (TIGR00288 family)
MESSLLNNESRVAVLVDCDNVMPAILEYALLTAARFGRIVLRRGYGNSSTLTSKWKETLVGLAFTPCLQFQYTKGKNTADIALALDAIEALFDNRADTFCLVTSDSDFAYLCRKLRERGAIVHIIGESKTPTALRNASDQFFEWEAMVDSAAEAVPEPNARAKGGPEPAKQEAPRSVTKSRPRFIVEAVSLLVGDTPEGTVNLGILGQYLKRTNPDFSPKTYGHSGLLNMIKTYDLLTVRQEEGGYWSVSLTGRDR